ncbi:bifunctional diaminohydroxyphosphoribosylaminopyrimidine deaminase/5-amino-6-(5-phosphoribosylamino)uracil reductase RibD [Salinibius halmophilus]|uniref:bifunctional diaminohydroxyphosphoribosylaminopyrimidine deaminase/5-amino-6-(5-phosphoribosylamino)uracil reductase RibD n=1 Tax=Salinibius halmophilus TaxID=1853216 RepID=UPI000E671647|nr:bifunctional diaminohydroxyphosphoribosylaminopyrimidine deaminase/5-amino-6-(5-phosphoribosylamino)uracil reductase RibD [Salinibius halmophilus]
MNDQQWMALAIAEAKRGRYTTKPNPRVGSVIVRNGELVGKGAHLQAGTLHAERHALAEAGERARGATAYVTLEPCSHHGRTPPCADGLIEAGVARVVMAMLDPNPQVAGNGKAKLEAAGIECVVGVCEQDAWALNPGFFQRMQTGQPRVTLKLGASLDGKTAMASGESQWITGASARADVQRERGEAGAILTTSATVVADQPSMDFRPEQAGLTTPEAPWVYPVKVVLDSQGKLTGSEKIFATAGDVWQAVSAPNVDSPAGVANRFICGGLDGQIDLNLLLDELGRQEINDVWVEAGATLAGSLLAAGLVDRLVLYVAPKLLGSDARQLFQLPIVELKDAIELNWQQITQVGDDLKLECTIKK